MFLPFRCCWHPCYFLTFLLLLAPSGVHAVDNVHSVANDPAIVTTSVAGNTAVAVVTAL
jgi:hypothetical protein